MIVSNRRSIISILPDMSWFVILVGAILTVPAPAEKVPSLAAWKKIVETQRNRLESFELEMRTYRFDVRQATRKIRFSEGEALLERAASIAQGAASQETETQEPFEALVLASRRLFGIEPGAPEVENAIHQRDLASGSYQVWEKNAGTLSIFDRRGSWQQGRGEISLGPPAGRGEIEVYLAKLGLLVPQFAVCEYVPESTPEESGEALVYLADLEGFRFRFGCEPWLGHGWVTTIEESPYWGEVNQGVWEKRRWFVQETARDISGEAVLTLPSFGVEIRYDTDGNVAFWAVSKPLGLKTQQPGWTAFPRERPPFGWSVLDYRFTPEAEYRFGFFQ